MDRLWTPWRQAYVAGEGKSDRRSGVPAALAAWPGDYGCVFCNLIGAVDYAIKQGLTAVEAERLAGILLRGQRCFVVLNAFPYNSGHLMVVPCAHEASLAALPSVTTEELMRSAQKAESALRAAYKPDGLNFGMNLGQAAGAGVADHLHLHGVPRWTGDTNYMTVLSQTRVLPEMIADSWVKLRAAFASLTADDEVE